MPEMAMSLDTAAVGHARHNGHMFVQWAFETKVDSTDICEAYAVHSCNVVSAFFRKHLCGKRVQFW